MVKFIIAIFAFASYSMAYAQELAMGIGARNSALGGASTTVADGWSVFNNPGAMGMVTTSSVNFTYQNRYNLEAFQILAASAIMVFDKFNLGIGGMREGDQFFNRQWVKVSIANQLQIVSLGGSIAWQQYYIESIGSRGNVIFEFGGVVDVIPKLLFGAHIYNFSQASISEDITAPVILKAGFSYKPTSQVSLNAEVLKNMQADQHLKVGLEYDITKIVTLRTGFITSPTSPAFGIGLNPGRFLLDYCFQQQNPVGAVHEFSMGYQLSKK